MRAKVAWAIAKQLTGKRTVQAESRNGTWGCRVDDIFFISESDLKEYLKSSIFPEFSVEIPQGELNLFTERKQNDTRRC